MKPDSARFMKTSIMMAAAAAFAVLLTAGCSGGGGGGSDSENPPVAKNAVLSGRVINNHPDEDAARRAIAGATVVLVDAADIETADSVSPVEDLAKADNGYPSAVTDANGYYQFTPDDFSGAYPANDAYFLFVDPPAKSNDLLPGGDASGASLVLGKSAIKKDIILSDTSGTDAAYVGSTVCLICHPQKASIKHTLHFTGIRKIGPSGTVTNDAMDLDDASVYDLSANNDEMLSHFTDPATPYTFADDAEKSFWLGKDADGLYFQLTSDTSPRFYIKYSYGGETGLWRGLFMTTVYAGDGTYAPDHGRAGTDYAYYVMAPIQYNEDPDSINGEKFVTYHAEQWDFSGTENNGFTADPELFSFDLACAACHGATHIKTIHLEPVGAKKNSRVSEGRQRVRH